jgi:hypothetical protein
MVHGAPEGILVAPWPRKSGTTHFQPGGIAAMTSCQLRLLRVKP